MGQKINPIGLRLGYIENWRSIWYANKKDYADMLNIDLDVREYLKKELAKASVSKVIIERPAQNAKITIHTARPGIVIGKKGEDVEKLKKAISGMMGVPVHVNIEEVRKPEADAQLVADSISQQLERRVMFRRAIKRAAQSAMRAGALGVKVSVSGRLGGAEIARAEWCKEGRIPLHTLRANINYATSEALTTYGIIGVKVWIFKGEIVGKNRTDTVTANTEDKPKRSKARKGAR